MQDKDFSVAVDIGGTFTDLVVSDGEGISGLYKQLTTRDDLFNGIEAGLRKAAKDLGFAPEAFVSQIRTFVYSTTHSTNAILERQTARTALLVTRGHRDILIYKEGGKDQINNWAIPFPQPYIPRHLTFELDERLGPDGEVLLPIGEAEVRKVLRRITALDVDAVAVSLLWSIKNPAHELAVARLIEQELPDTQYSLSHRVNPVIREYRRTSATAIDASLKPLMAKHLKELKNRLQEAGFGGRLYLVSHVDGGVQELEVVSEKPILTVDSGPALAPVTGGHIDLSEHGESSSTVLVVDAGGTSFDVSMVLDGVVARTKEKWLGKRWYGDMTGLAAVDTQSVGAGGGSLIWVDAAGLMHVGPKSAGSKPGPACYGLGGTKPTVTDPAVVPGYIDPANFAGGSMTLDKKRAHEAMDQHVAAKLGVGVEEAAESAIVIAAEEMRGLLVDVTIAQGRDARECTLVAGGGASGINIVRIARELGIQTVLIPHLAGGLSALGGLFSEIRSSFVRSVYTLSSDFEYEEINQALSSVRSEMEAFVDAVPEDGPRKFRYSCEARYDRQLWEIDVDIPFGEFRSEDDVASLKSAFDAMHQRLFQNNQPEAPIELLAVRGEASVLRSKPSLEKPVNVSDPQNGGAGQYGRRTVIFDGQALEASIIEGQLTRQGDVIAAPAVIEESNTTIVLPPGSRAMVRNGHYRVETGV